MKISEAATGIGEEMADTGLAIQRAQDKTEQMQARAAAVDEFLVEAGALEDFTTGETSLDRELARSRRRARSTRSWRSSRASLAAGGAQKELEEKS